jgi:hypothetical protein
MRSVPVLAAAAIIGASALTVACGQQRAGSAASGPPASTAPATASPAAATPSAGHTATSAPPPAAACGAATAIAPPGTLTLTGADNGKSFCVKRGTGVLIYLRGTATAKWSLLKSSSAALVPSANGHLALALGVTGGYFVAAGPGSAVISSTRSPCGAPSPPTMSGSAGCGVIELFRVTVGVAG